jgi:hypothetical protein
MSHRTALVVSFSLSACLLLGAAGCGGSGSANGSAGGSTGTGAKVGSAGGHSGTGGAVSGGGGTVGGGGGTVGGVGGTSGGTPTGGTLGKLPITQCNDGIDNDGDGKIDLADPECVSPLDNDESSFATGIPGDNIDACKQDCFFDGNSGMGDDGCQWELKCDPANVGAGAAASCPYDPAYNNCPTTQSQKCINSCQALTPKGCDCFGCCTVDGINHPIRLDPTCTAADFNDPAKCPVCTQQTTCMKTCGPCDLCLGRTTVDPSCNMSGAGGGSGTGNGGAGGNSGGGAGGAGGAPQPHCLSNQVVCGLNASLCPQMTICISGCCEVQIF